MKQSSCSNCGADEFIFNNDVKVCKYCNSKYQLEEEDLPKKKAEVSLKNDIDILLQKCKDDPSNAKRYAGRILDIDPTNREAMIYFK